MYSASKNKGRRLWGCHCLVVQNNIPNLTPSAGLPQVADDVVDNIIADGATDLFYFYKYLFYTDLLKRSGFYGIFCQTLNPFSHGLPLVCYYKDTITTTISPHPLPTLILQGHHSYKTKKSPGSRFRFKFRLQPNMSRGWGHRESKGGYLTM